MGEPLAHSGPTGRRGIARALACAIALLCVAFALPPSAALADSSVAAEAARNPNKLFIDADQIFYDRDHDTVTATGSVVVYYNHKILQADKVIYDRGKKRVKAEGRTKYTDEHKNVTYAPHFDFSDDFVVGFADSAQQLAIDKTRFTSPRIERSAGGVTVLNQAIYTACEPCKEHPDMPPEWQVRAGKIIENQQDHEVYFENAWIDLLGVPIAYFPYLSAPDSTVVRQTGMLAPAYGVSSNLGYSVSVPYFFALAPNYDLTLTPAYYTLQGAGMDATWRQRLENGEYGIEVRGVQQLSPGYLALPPAGAGNLTMRGSVQSGGKILLNDSWTLGWDLNWFSDRYYLTDYKLATISASQLFMGEAISSVYLRGQSGRGFFDLSGYNFMPTMAFLDQRQDPTAAPVFDYHRTFPVDPALHSGLGGEITVDLNAASINRTEALYQSVGGQEFDTTYNTYSVCRDNLGNPSYKPGTTSNNCLLRGIAGDTSRATAQVAWQDKYVDPIGEVWKPFVFARASGETLDLNTTSAFSYGGSNVIQNSTQTNFYNSGSSATAMPGVGLEYRYPFTASTPLGQQTIEPIAQLIVRPNETVSSSMPNEDAQSLVFDTTTLFSWSKYSGYDRVEGGTRLNYGLQYTDNFDNGGHLTFVAGQSIQLAGQNSYTIANAANVGLESGLDKTYSDFVASETLQPFGAPITFTSRQQFDSTTLQLNRFDAIAQVYKGAWGGSLDYANYAAQPELGYPYARQGLTATAQYRVDKGLTISGGVTFDMSRQYYDVPGESTSPLFTPWLNFGVSYETSCTTLKATYTSAISDPLWTSVGSPAVATRNQTLMLQLTLRTLGNFSTSIGQSSTIGN